MKKNIIRGITCALSVLFTMNVGGTVAFARENKFVGEYKKGEILSFGSSLTKTQEAELRKYFKAPDDIKATYVTTDVAIKQLGLPESMKQTYKGGWYSSAYVKVTGKGSGVKVTADNLTLVTDDMLANALITSGVLNAEVIASAPFKVSGESALAGILSGVEDILGESLAQDNKETAQKEIETTLDLADEIGKKEASSIINDIKAEVIKNSPTTNIQIENIVVNVANNYNINLSNESKARVVELMSEVNKLDIDYKDVKSTLKQASEKFRDDMKALGKEIKESGIFEKMWNWIKNALNSFLDLFKNDDTIKPEIEDSSVNNPIQDEVPELDAEDALPNVDESENIDKVDSEDKSKDESSKPTNNAGSKDKDDSKNTENNDDNDEELNKDEEKNSSDNNTSAYEGTGEKDSE